MDLYLGIDGGGSSTRCAVGDEHRVLGSATTSSCKIARVGAAAARQALQSAISGACSDAAVNARDISQACIGIAGASRQEVIDAAHQWAAELIGGKVQVVGDMVVALEAAHGGNEGIIVIAGTGSICFGRDQQGHTARAGGAGPIVSDEGSGDWIGRAAVQQALRAPDHDQLRAALMKAWQVHTAAEFKEKHDGNSPPDFAALFPAVQAVAAEGHRGAHELLCRAGAELARLAHTVMRELWPRPERVRVGLAGGVLENSAIVRTTFVTRVRADLEPMGYGIAISFGSTEPVTGALSLARKMAPASAKAKGN